MSDSIDELVDWQLGKSPVNTLRVCVVCGNRWTIPTTSCPDCHAVSRR